MFDSISNTNLVLAVLLAVLVIQFVFVVRVVGMMRMLRRYLNEVRFLFKQIGNLDTTRKRAMYDYRSCQYCKHRQSFILIGDQNAYDDFYYKCNKRKVTISLADTCDAFERDFQLK